MSSNDLDLGFVSLREIRSIWQEAMRELDKYVWPDRSSVSRDAVLKHFEMIEYKLRQKAKANHQAFYAKPSTQKLEEKPDSRAEYKSRIETMRTRQV